MVWRRRVVFRVVGIPVRRIIRTAAGMIAVVRIMPGAWTVWPRSMVLVVVGSVPIRVVLLDPVRMILHPPLTVTPLMLIVVIAIVHPLRMFVVPVRMVLIDPVWIVLMPPIFIAPLMT